MAADNDTITEPSIPDGHNVVLTRRYMMRVKRVGTMVAMMMTALLLPIGARAENGQDATTTEVNVRLLGALGDGKADDTAAVQKGLDMAKSGGGLFIPPGNYRITKTLRVERCSGLTVRGQAGLPWKRGEKTSATLFWDGDQNGVLLDTVGVSGGRFENLNLDGNGKAGTLLRFLSAVGWGNMLHKFDNLHLMNADVGLQFGGGGSPDMCNSDMLFTYTTFARLKRGMLVKNNQGVDFMFNYLFGLGCDTIFDFEKGGNLLVNTAQMTDCKLFLDIGGGGRCAGTYLCNNVRIESGDGGKANRFQALKSYPANHQAVVRFVNYCDAQWNWSANGTEKRELPFFDVGPGTSLSIESAIFNGPVASLAGAKDAPASLVARGCSFGFIKPEDAVKANELGYFKLLDNFTDSMAPLSDVVKWPSLPPVILNATAIYRGKGLQPPPAGK